MFRILCDPSSGNTELPLTVVPSRPYRTHIPQAKSRSTSSLVIFNIKLVFLVPHCTNLTFPFHITVQNYAANTDQAHDKIFVNH